MNHCRSGVDASLSSEDEGGGRSGVEWMPHCLQKMKVEEAFPYESMSKIGNQEQGRGETMIKIHHIDFTKSKYRMK